MAKIEEKTYTLIVVTVMSFVGPLMMSGVTIALPTIGDELGLNAVGLGWITLVYTITSAIFVLPFGRLADIYGRKKVMLAGLVVFIVTSLLCALAPNGNMLIVFRALQGVGAAMSYSVSVALLTSAHPAEERGKVLGINVAAVYLGLSLGPTIGGVLTHNLGWRSIFILSVIMTLIAIALILIWIKSEWAEARGEKYDYVGSLLISVMLFALIYGFSLLPTTQGLCIFGAGIATSIAFVLWEKHTPSPLLKLDILTSSRFFPLSTLTQFIYYMSIFPVMFTLSLYLQYIRGFSPQNAGFIILAQPVIQMIVSPVAGRLSQYIQPRILVSAGMICAMAGIALLFGLWKDAAIPFIVGSLCLVGFGHAFFASPNTNAIMSSVDRKNYGVAAAVESTSRFVGQNFGMGIVMLILAHFLGTAQITPDNYPAFIESVDVLYIILIGLTLISLVPSIMRGKLSRI